MKHMSYDVDLLNVANIGWLGSWWLCPPDMMDQDYSVWTWPYLLTYVNSVVRTHCRSTISRKGRLKCCWSRQVHKY